MKIEPTTNKSYHIPKSWILLAVFIVSAIVAGAWTFTTPPDMISNQTGTYFGNTKINETGIITGNVTSTNIYTGNRIFINSSNAQVWFNESDSTDRKNTTYRLVTDASAFRFDKCNDDNCVDFDVVYRYNQTDPTLNLSNNVGAGGAGKFFWDYLQDTLMGTVGLRDNDSIWLNPYGTGVYGNFGIKWFGDNQTGQNDSLLLMIRDANSLLFKDFNTSQFIRFYPRNSTISVKNITGTDTTDGLIITSNGASNAMTVNNSEWYAGFASGGTVSRGIMRIDSSNNVNINAPANQKIALEVGLSDKVDITTNGNVSVLTNGGGVCVKSGTGTSYLINVSNSGTLQAIAVTCS